MPEESIVKVTGMMHSRSIRKILAVLLEMGPLTNGELSSLTKLSAVSEALKELFEAGIVRPCLKKRKCWDIEERFKGYNQVSFVSRLVNNYIGLWDMQLKKEDNLKTFKKH
jgi:DNA-binding transcriptional ArsR family regulator